MEQITKALLDCADAQAGLCSTVRFSGDICVNKLKIVSTDQIPSLLLLQSEQGLPYLLF